MEVVLLKKDGRCRWLENKVLKDLLPTASRVAANPFAKKLYVIVDWISNDRGRVGVDLKWFRSLGIPAFATFKEVPAADEDFKIINTGYDSIVTEELVLRSRGVEILDQPCPFVRRLRDIFEEADPAYQYVFLCDPNHLTIKNFSSIFPKDMILVQAENYEEKILEQQNGKPLRVIPYVTFLRRHGEAILDFLNERFPDRTNDKIETSCLWVSSKASPIVEVDQISGEQLEGVQTALLIGPPGSNNKSLLSLEEAVRAKGLDVVRVCSLRDFLKYQKQHSKDKVLLARSPIPNQVEAPILAYIEGGLLKAWWTIFKQNTNVRRLAVRSRQAALYVRNILQPSRAKQEAAELGLLKKKYAVTWIQKG